MVSPGRCLVAAVSSLASAEAAARRRRACTAGRSARPRGCNLRRRPCLTPPRSGSTRRRRLRAQRAPPRRRPGRRRPRSCSAGRATCRPARWTAARSAPPCRAPCTRCTACRTAHRRRGRRPSRRTRPAPRRRTAAWRPSTAARACQRPAYSSCTATAASRWTRCTLTGALDRPRARGPQGAALPPPRPRAAGSRWCAVSLTAALRSHFTPHRRATAAC